MDLNDHLVPTPLPWAGTPSITPDCSEPHPEHFVGCASKQPQLGEFSASVGRSVHHTLFSAPPSSSGGNSSHSPPAPIMGDSLLHSLLQCESFLKKCSSVGAFHRVQSLQAQNAPAWVPLGVQVLPTNLVQWRLFSTLNSQWIRNSQCWEKAVHDRGNNLTSLLVAVSPFYPHNKKMNLSVQLVPSQALLSA